MNGYIKKQALMDYCSNQVTRTIDLNDISRFPIAKVYTKDEVIEVLEGTLKEILEEADNYNDGTYCCINVIQNRINALRGEEE